MALDGISTVISCGTVMAYTYISGAILFSVNLTMAFFGIYAAQGTAIPFLLVVAVWMGSLVVACALATYERRQPSRPAKPRRAAGDVICN